MFLSLLPTLPAVVALFTFTLYLHCSFILYLYIVQVLSLFSPMIVTRRLTAPSMYGFVTLGTL